MATGILLEFQGMGEKEYDRLMEMLGTDRNRPEGAILHVAGPIPNGWRVFNVFESQDSYEKFYKDRLTGAFKQVGIPNPTRFEYFPIHNAFATDAAALNAFGVAVRRR